MKIVPLLNKRNAIKFYESELWKQWTDEQIFVFQMMNEVLCVDFDIFHDSVNRSLCRKVYTHELSKPDLLVKEFITLKGKLPSKGFENGTFDIMHEIWDSIYPNNLKI